jgi:molybdopterin synthase sulfur carrier subunit
LTDSGGPAVVHLPRSLTSLFPEAERRMPASGDTVLEVVRDLDTRVPGLANRVLDAGPSIRRHLNLFVEGELAELDTPVPSGAQVHVIPAVSGG